MEGLFIFGCLLVALIWWLRYRRAREIEAFMDSDMSILETMRPEIEERTVDPLLAKAEAYIQRATSEPDSAPDSVQAPQYQLKEVILPVAKLGLLQTLERELNAGFRLFINMALSDFVKTDVDLGGRSISYLICERDSMKVVAGIEFQSGSDKTEEIEILQNIFEQIGKPLLLFPQRNQIPVREVKQTLALIRSELDSTRICRKCGRQMTLKKAVKGKNVGKRFWICVGFPGCKGVVRL